MPESVLVINKQSPGDYIVMSSAIRDLARRHPGRYRVAVKTATKDVWRENPYIEHEPLPVEPKPNAFKAGYPLIHKSNQERVHFMWGFIEDMNRHLQLDGSPGQEQVVLTEFRPDLHLTDEEKSVRPFKEPYWVMASGGKYDFTAKWWNPARWQTVVDSLAKQHVLCVQVGEQGHYHPKMAGTIDMVGKTRFRDLMKLIYHAEGVMCVVTCLMHIAAAFNRPCVVVAGGREPWWWEAYTAENRLTNMRRGIPDWNPPETDFFIPHRYIHTCGQLDCCKAGGCWKGSVVTNKEKDRCKAPYLDDGATIPQCLAMITPELVHQCVMSYYEDGTLTR